MRKLLAALALYALAGVAHAQEAPEAAPVADPAATEAPAGPSEADLVAAQAFYDSLDRRTGIISLVGGKVELNVPATHYYVGPADARRIIVELWGNPPAAGENVEGMLFLASANPATDGWGAVLEYLADGHVDDSEAATINYTDLLHQLQEDARNSNPARREQGYPEITIDGWAEPPHYTSPTHTLYWAKLLTFGDQGSSLNYDIRVLGREGVFVVSFVAKPEEIEEIRTQAPSFMTMPHFTQGNTYADYREGIDARAAYGIGGLIAGGALAAVAQKAGVLALILGFGKKFIILIIAGAAGLFSMVRRMFGKKDEPPGSDDAPPPPAA
jgi:uncharacterized membrane-anchored protein